MIVTAFLALSAIVILKSCDMTWTDERVELLKKLHADKTPAPRMAEEFGLTRSAVIGKLHRLGLTASYSPRDRARVAPAVAAKAANRAAIETEKLRLMRSAQTRSNYSHGMGGLLRTVESKKPVTLPKLNLPDLVD